MPTPASCGSSPDMGACSRAWPPSGARKWSLDDDDALDAYQRALEIYLRRLDTVEQATEVNWMAVVVKNEALAIRRQRAQSLPAEELDFDSRPAEGLRPVHEVVAGRERVG